MDKFFDSGYRTPPKVPGINAELLMPSIGTGTSRTSPKGRLVQPGARLKVAPFGGRARLDSCPPSKAAKPPKPHRFAAPKVPDRPKKRPAHYPEGS